MALISFNNHYSEKVDHFWPTNLPIRPHICFEAVFTFLKNCGLDRNTIHTIVMPGVREGLVLVAYHALMGHFPNILYSRREGEGWVWDLFHTQTARQEKRTKRRSL